MSGICFEPPGDYHSLPLPEMNYDLVEIGGYFKEDSGDTSY